MTEYKKMDQEVKARWVAALRSGEYEQGQHLLRQPMGATEMYCCLGVLCEVVGVPRAVEGYSIDGGLSTNAGLPVETRRMVQLSLAAEEALIYRNDELEASFEDIALFIERCL